MRRIKIGIGGIMSQDSKQYSCIIRFLDDSEPLTVTYQVRMIYDMMTVWNCWLNWISFEGCEWSTYTKDF